MSVYAVIMAGGSGTRLWPLSRFRHPKFLICPEGKKSFLELTIRRLQGLIPRSRVRIVCGEIHRRPIRKAIRSLKPQNFIVEPAARNTAPCIGLAAVKILKEDPEAVLVVLPADHDVGNVSRFRKTLRQAVDFARKEEAIVAVGIVPTEPHTGYGYIEASRRRGESRIRPDKVRRFFEKPDLPTARRYLRSGRFYWNGGIFVGRAALFLKEIRRFMPELYRGLMKIERYPRLRSESIDVGVMEKSDRLWVVPGRFGWTDVGDLTELAKFAEDGHALSIDSRNVVVLNGKRLVVTLGVRDLIIAETEDALLVASRKRAQEVKKVPQLLLERGWRRYV